MKNLLFIFFMSMSCLQLQAQQISVNSGWGWKNKSIKASRNVIQKNIPVSSNFNSIINSGVIDVYYTPADEYSITLEADDNIIDYIDVKFNQNKLELGVKKNTAFRNAKAFKVFVSSPDLKFLQLNGSGDFYCNEFIKVSEFETQQNGSGDININRIEAETASFLLKGSGDIKVQDEITAKNISFETRGSGDIRANVVTAELIAKSKGSGDLTLSGTTDSAEFYLFGSGEVSAFQLTAKNIVAETKGSGDILVRVSDTLQAKSFGSGDIIYKGNPSVEKNEHGSGEVYRK